MHGILALLHKEGVLCIICTVARCHQMGYIIFTKCSVYCNSAFCKCSAICSGLVDSLLLFAFCLVLQDSLGNVDDSSVGVSLGIAFLPPLPSPGFVFF